tara:strand:+ start:2482 stop:2985 length:504 start_codon:yes stop_codon:yes gene_type:complete
MRKPKQFKSVDLFPTLDEAISWLPSASESKEGALCPCCLKFNKVYHRNISISTIKALFRLYRLNENMAGSYHSREFTASHSGGDFAKVASLGLFHKIRNEDTKKKHSGYWLITDSGKEFCRGKLQIQEKLVIYQNKLVGTEGEFKYISDFWPNFDYGEMMNNGSIDE